MAALEMLERGSVKAAPARGGCEGCPAAGGGCAGCPFRRPLTSERVFVIENIKELLKEKELPVGTIYFGSSERQGSGGAPVRTVEKTCSICKESICTCIHSETSK